MEIEPHDSTDESTAAIHAVFRDANDDEEEDTMDGITRTDGSLPLIMSVRETPNAPLRAAEDILRVPAYRPRTSQVAKRLRFVSALDRADQLGTPEAIAEAKAAMPIYPEDQDSFTQTLQALYSYHSTHPPTLGPTTWGTMSTDRDAVPDDDDFIDHQSDPYSGVSAEPLSSTDEDYDDDDVDAEDECSTPRMDQQERLLAEFSDFTRYNPSTYYRYLLMCGRMRPNVVALSDDGFFDFVDDLYTYQRTATQQKSLLDSEFFSTTVRPIHSKVLSVLKLDETYLLQCVIAPVGSSDPTHGTLGTCAACRQPRPLTYSITHQPSGVTDRLGSKCAKIHSNYVTLVQTINDLAQRFAPSNSNDPTTANPIVPPDDLLHLHTRLLGILDQLRIAVDE